MNTLMDALAWVLPVALAIILHEVAHGWMAERFGDPTARLSGRITVNPISHIDPLGSVAIPFTLAAAGSPMMFGYARPVPVDFSRLHPLRLGMFMVALAGPLCNVLQAFIAGLLLHLESVVTPEQAPWLFLNLYRALLINCGLAIFNMIPLLPLDGGRVLFSLLPPGGLRALFARTERFGIWVVFALLLLPGMLGLNLDRILGIPVFWLIKTVMFLTGNTME